MKRLFLIILILLLAFSSISVYADSLNSKLTILEKPMADDPPIFIGTPYPEQSRDGYIEKIDKNGNKYKHRVRHLKLKYIDPALHESRYLFSLYRGKTITLTETYYVSRTSSWGWSQSTNDSISFKDAETQINSSVTTTLKTSNSHTVSYTYSKGTKYSFPENAPPDKDYCSLFAGFNHAIYEIIIDYVPCVTSTKMTKIIGKNMHKSISPYPGDQPYDEYDVVLMLEDKRVIFIHAKSYSSAKAILSSYADNWYRETEEYYDFNNRKVFDGTLQFPIYNEMYRYI